MIFPGTLALRWRRSSWCVPKEPTRQDFLPATPTGGRPIGALHPSISGPTMRCSSRSTTACSIRFALFSFALTATTRKTAIVRQHQQYQQLDNNNNWTTTTTVIEPCCHSVELAACSSYYVFLILVFGGTDWKWSAGRQVSPGPVGAVVDHRDVGLDGRLHPELYVHGCGGAKKKKDVASHPW